MSAPAPPPAGTPPPAALPSPPAARPPSPAVFDPGLQPERTLLAWRRTCLSFAVASLLAMRFTVSHLGPVAVVGGILCAGLAVLAYVLAATGYRRTHDDLHTAGVLLRGGLPMLAATLGVLAIGALCAAFLVVGAVSAGTP
ncbi:DUF202 domain-containing protein [Brachybacterium sp. J153]|uniref:DUF202 domain-containing protein n=1 Tax=Brachybacterium sp. J153 TaxID=3116488 RepID=UPI002E76F0CD|nr:DUF202 domain-containing protein [Brachybacterium sp. J153]MEE1617882.1 DUF202 domain-containing protein [Brachybacterium sp. J153]